MILEIANKTAAFARKALPLLLAGSLLLPISASAATGGLKAIEQGMKTTASGAGYATPASGGLEAMVGSLINALLSLVGLILFVYMLYGGFIWMTAAGDSKKVGQAQDIIKNAIIGIIIIAAAWVISNQVLQYLIAASNPSVSATPAKN